MAAPAVSFGHCGRRSVVLLSLLVQWCSGAVGYKAGEAGAAQAAAEVVRADPGVAPALLAVRTGTGNDRRPDNRTTGKP